MFLRVEYSGFAMHMSQNQSVEYTGSVMYIFQSVEYSGLMMYISECGVQWAHDVPVSECGVQRVLV